MNCARSFYHCINISWNYTKLTEKQWRLSCKHRNEVTPEILQFPISQWYSTFKYEPSKHWYPGELFYFFPVYEVRLCLPFTTAPFPAEISQRYPQSNCSSSFSLPSRFALRYLKFGRKNAAPTDAPPGAGMTPPPPRVRHWLPYRFFVFNVVINQDTTTYICLSEPKPPEKSGFKKRR